MPSTTLSLPSAVSAVTRILTEFDVPAIAEQFTEARKEAAIDINLIMTRVVPLIFEVQGHIMSEFGFECDDAGFEAFAGQLKAHEAHEEFNALANKLKAKMKELTTPIEEEDEDGEGEDESEGDESATEESEIPN